MSFGEFENMFSSRKYESMLRDVTLFDIEERTAKERIDQLNQFRKINTAVKGAALLLRIKAQHELTGDFEPVELIAEVSVD